MTNDPGISPISGISSATSSSSLSGVSLSMTDLTLAALQAQLLAFSQVPSVQTGPANTDYRALQAAIQSGNVLEAQTALALLQRDSGAGSAKTTAMISTTSPVTSPVPNEVLQNGGSAASLSSTPSPLDTSA